MGFNGCLPGVMGDRPQNERLAARIVVDCRDLITRVDLTGLHVCDRKAVVTKPHVIVERHMKHPQGFASSNLHSARTLERNCVEVPGSNRTCLRTQLCLDCDPWFSIVEPDMLKKFGHARGGAANDVLMCRTLLHRSA